MKNKKYLKAMFGQTSGADNSFEYKIGEVNVANTWDPYSTDPKEMGGFNFSVEDKIIRWLVRGDTLYDVTIPDDAEIINVPHQATPDGVLRANKIIISNPRPITDDLAMELYLKSTIPEKSYYKTMAGCAIRGRIKTAKKILEDKINKDNIDLAIQEFQDFCNWDDNKEFDETKLNKEAKEIYDMLLEIKGE